MTAAFLPFNQNPDSIAIKTSTYTIPADFYARVLVSSFEEDFTIDSVIAINATHVAGSISVSSGTIYTNTTPYTLIGNCSSGGVAASGYYVNDGANTGGSIDQELRSPYGSNSPVTSATDVGNNQRQGVGTHSLSPLFVPPDALIVGDGGLTTRYYLLDAIDPPSDAIFWVPTGTDLDGSRYTVELYAIP